MKLTSRRAVPASKAMEDFDWETARVARSDRHMEIRWIATGYIGERLYRVVFTERGEVTRIISLRRASKGEEREYART